jgi:hypothetical protein
MDAKTRKIITLRMGGLIHLRRELTALADSILTSAEKAAWRDLGEAEGLAIQEAAAAILAGAEHLGRALSLHETTTQPA